MGRQDRATLVSICDQAGRTRGTGFVADHLGTVVTTHETIAGLGRIVLRAPDGSGCAVTSDAVTALPADALALIRAEGLAVRPLAIATRPAPDGAYVRVHALGWREARVLATVPASYADGRTAHPVGDVLALAIGTEGREALQGGDAAGSPVLDAATGTVLAVLAPALRTGHPTAAPALPLATAAARAPGGPLARLLGRNAATVPSYGPDLNLAGALRLAGLTHPAPPAVRPVPRHHLDHHLALFTAGGPGVDPRPPAARPAVCALVGEPGTGRTTLLAETARRHGTGGAPAVWLRGADLRDGDLSLADAVGRVLGRAGRAVAAADGDWSAYPAAHPAALRDLARRVARLGADAGRPLLVLLDGPEETPPALAARQPDWTADTLRWLRRHGARLALACGPAHWETAGPLYPAGSLYGYDPAPHAAAPAGAALPVGDLTRQEAEQARARYGLPAGALAAPDARHPLALRLLADLRAALPGAVPERAARDDLFAAHLNLLCLRAARRVAAGCRPAPVEAELRGLAARVAGRVHEAARRCLGPGHGELDRGAFEELFPWGTGWASAVLAEGLLVPAGAGYRFADEEFGEWLQAAHLDLDAALEALVLARREDAPPPDRLPCGGAVRGGPDGAGVARGGVGAGGAVPGGAASAGGAGPRGAAHRAVPVGGAGPEGAPRGGAAPVSGALLGAAAFDGAVFDGTALDGSVPGGALVGGAALAGAVLDGSPVGTAPFGGGASGAVPGGGGAFLGAVPGGAVAGGAVAGGGGARAVDGGGGRAVAGRAASAGAGPGPRGCGRGRRPGGRRGAGADAAGGPPPGPGPARAAPRGARGAGARRGAAPAKTGGGEDV
ncbi:serine protease, partial [Streptomyces fradiae]